MNDMNSNFMSEAIALWVGEAMALSSLGMPAGSFSLIFDGDPIPDRSSEALEIVRRDAIWQAAFEESHKRGYLPKEPIEWHWSRHRTSPWFQVHLDFSFVSEMFPQTLLDIIKGKSIISFNFPIGLPWEDNEVEVLIDAHKGWSSENWDKESSNSIPKGLDTKPPLLPWVEMSLDELDQESEGAAS
ncbi:hypothetical protein BS50DRAFT_653910 [Corynespora cassiicola Philippines]|uniref:Uncharacterized protein n=1 Tax=Corynespora cassiicola Philippines TaxID=1448308 RepID=A0A2T2P6W7_CORCC|nr:hypothetical protein BS50DRAFT_653910 [Corynespora cassiicola Philippines]